MTRTTSLLLLWLTLSCSGGAQDGGDAGGTATDASSPSIDASATIDASAPAHDATPGELPTTCTGTCTTMTLTAEFGGTTRSFERAFFGLVSPQNSDSGNWEIYIENGAGGDDQCPSMDSPTPRYLLILASLPLPNDDATPVSGIANLVDFEGALLPQSLVEEASSNTVTWRAFDPCIACAEGTEPDRASRMVAVDIETTFEGGTIIGHSYATHCDSLDDL